MVGMLDGSFNPSTYGGSSAMPAWMQEILMNPSAGAIPANGASPPPQVNDNAQLPANSTPTADMEANAGGGGSGQPAVPDSSLMGRMKGILGKLTDGSNSNFLMAMGAGMLGAPSLGIGLSRGLAAGIQGRQADIKMQQYSGQLMSRYNTLRKAGATQNEAIGSMYDDDLYKKMLDKYVAGAPTFQTVKEPSTGRDITAQIQNGKIIGFVNPTSTSNGGTGGGGASPPQVNSPSDFAKFGLKKGDPYIAPDGSTQYFNGNGFGGGQ